MPSCRPLTSSALAGLLVLACLSTSGLAQESQGPPAPEPVQLSSSEGYQGVCPGTDHPPAVAPPASAGGNAITWPGFQMLPDGGSRVFVQSTGALSPRLEHRGRELFVHLGKARLAHRNNARPLVTRFFNTPVVEASIELKRGEAVLVLQLRDEVVPTVRTETRPSTGYHFLILEFPAGTYVDGARPPAVAARTPTAPTGATGATPTHLDATGSADASASGSVEGATARGTATGKASGKVSLGF